jgi:hypothetical protein
MSLHQIKTHPEFVEGCFGCKISTLQLNTGDAHKAMSQKNWDAELDAYANARAQGIQPSGTTMKAIDDALKASDVIGGAYNAETMPAASEITKASGKVMKETGIM